MASRTVKTRVAVTHEPIRLGDTLHLTMGTVIAIGPNRAIVEGHRDGIRELWAHNEPLGLTVWRRGSAVLAPWPVGSGMVEATLALRRAAKALDDGDGAADITLPADIARTLIHLAASAELEFTTPRPSDPGVASPPQF